MVHTPDRRRPDAIPAALAAALLPALLALAALVPPAAAATPAPPPAPVCAAAASLTTLGDPGAAIATITEARKAEPAATGAAPLCAAEYAQAVQRQASADALVRWAEQAQRATDAAAEVEADGGAFAPAWTAPPPTCAGSDADAPAAAPTTEAAARAAISAAATAAAACDVADAAAAALVAELAPPGDTAAEATESAWSDFRESWVDPWLTLLAVLLAWVAVVLVTARLVLARLHNRGVADLARSTWLRRLTLGSGLVGLVLSAAYAVGVPSVLRVGYDTSWDWGEGTDPVLMAVLLLALAVLVVERVRSGATSVASSPTGAIVALGGATLLVAALLLASPLEASIATSGLDPAVGWAAATGLASAVLLALAWGATKQLTVTATGSGPSAEHLRSLVHTMAGSRPDGIEVPQGTDADLLKDVGIVEESTTAWVAALARVLKLLVPPTPWKLVVAESGGRVVVDLSRNGRLVDSVSLDRATTFDFLPASDAAAVKELDVGAFPAAMAAVLIAREHGHTRGLAGATQWCSVALQHLATQQERSSDLARRLAARAVEIDDGNYLALTGYWHTLYREETDPKKLQQYSELLTEAVKAPALAEEPALRLRLMYTRVAAGINRAAALAIDSAGRGVDHSAAASHATELLAALETASGTDIDPDFLASMRAASEVLVLSVPDCPAEKWKRPTAHLRSPEEYGTSLNYSAGCYLAESGGRDGRAAEHLLLAATDTELAAWMAKDPQLAAYRTRKVTTGAPAYGITNAYRTAFGRAIPEKMLDAAPFSDHAAALRSGGFVTIERLSRATWEQLTGVGLSGPTASWLRQLAVVAMSARAEVRLRPWHLAITAELADMGEIDLPPLSGTMADLDKRLSDRLLAYTSSPGGVRPGDPAPAVSPLMNWLTERAAARLPRERPGSPSVTTPVR